MKILFIGDIVGKPGRRIIKRLLPGLVAEKKIDFVIANCENAAGGFGVTRDILDELLQSPIDVFTSGNHIWDKKDIIECMDEYRMLLRPLNYPEKTPGWGSITVCKPPFPHGISVINLEGRTFMRPIDCPFRTVERELNCLKNKSNIVIVDIHAEATSEKEAMGWFLDGKVSAVIGTHTHVQTADETILPRGTAYITDAGMTGAHDSILGIRKEMVIERFLTARPNKFEVAKGDVRLQGITIEVDDMNCRSINITRVNLKESGG
ncbi:MAG: TIGR00282 family metallophosphoesterase [Syntrophales bacterium]|jgi:metallophosphoesterase (TIGR00282 family)|nr:TIGR00282 family metallophosphoesterase [Syntrophales bacterium]MDY0044465.1 TIGR00282 family metallophosphoesterase [Syntrophales bacterium]